MDFPPHLRLPVWKVEFNPDQEAFIRQAIKDGRVASTEDAVQEALRLWEYRSADAEKSSRP